VFGTVTAFDEPRGLGEVSDGASTWPFHCTAIADGTRTIAVGARVAFEVRAGHLGRDEAVGLETLAS
jgi:cold shock CspA family protein